MLYVYRFCILFLLLRCLLIYCIANFRFFLLDFVLSKSVMKIKIFLNTSLHLSLNVKNFVCQNIYIYIFLCCCCCCRIVCLFV